MLGAILPTVGLTEGAAFGLGFRRYTSVQTPAPGALPSVRFDGSEVWRLVTISFTVTTTAGVANRNLALQVVNEDSIVVYEVPLTAAIVASSAVLVSYQVNQAGNYVGANGDSCLSLPDLLLPGGFSWQLVAQNFAAGDTITKILQIHEAFPVGALGYPAGQNFLRQMGQ